MDKQTFYAELTERLLNVGLSREYIERHLAQFDGYFKGKSDAEIEAEIEKLGDLDKVAARIKRMTEKAISDAKEELESKDAAAAAAAEPVIINRDEDEIEADSSIENSSVEADFGVDDDVVVFEGAEDHEPQADESIGEDAGEVHGTKRGHIVPVEGDDTSITSAPIDSEIIEKNRRKFWIIFAATLPITLAILAGTAFCFGLMFFALAIVVLMSIGALIFVTAAGTLVSVFGLIFGVSQMISSVPIGLYECGVSIMIGAFALAIGILVYNFAVRFMPIVAKWLLKFVRYVIRKYRELYIHLKKECIGL